jgi:hypothetical protein
MVGFAKPMDFKPPVPITITTHNDVLLGERGGGGCVGNERGSTEQTAGGRANTSPSVVLQVPSGYKLGPLTP